MMAGILIVLLSPGERGGKNCVEWDIMQMQCVMDIFTLCIHMYNIIDGIVGINFSIFCKRRVPILIIFRSITKYGIVW